ncbi:predicted protein [Botrytis cinerea T4]|uniref:Uncharacterized protein n=1 Tax=Botryotinia fuckeliana (strain T4) TaxID=999810 RepID=G2YXF1_BOTF4|nr:predicted protein [Botrytis cinerea T4]
MLEIDISRSDNVLKSANKKAPSHVFACRKRGIGKTLIDITSTSGGETDIGGGRSSSAAAFLLVDTWQTK